MAAILAAQCKHIFSNENHNIFLQIALDFGLVIFTALNIHVPMQYIYILNHTLLAHVIKDLKKARYQITHKKRHNKADKSSLMSVIKNVPKWRLCYYWIITCRFDKLQCWISYPR